MDVFGFLQRFSLGQKHHKYVYMFLCASSCFYSCLVWFGSLCMLAPPEWPVAPWQDVASMCKQTSSGSQASVDPLSPNLFGCSKPVWSCLSSLLAALPLTMRLYRPCRTALDSRAIPAQRANCRDHLQIAHIDKEWVEPCQILTNDSKLGASLMGRQVSLNFRNQLSQFLLHGSLMQLAG